jgi:translocation and assembly module TamB
VAAALLLAAVAGALVLRSEWFRGKARTWLVSSIETATGGRAEMGAIRFDLATLRVEADSFVLHGTEPAGKPPLFRAASIVVGLKNRFAGRAQYRHSLARRGSAAHRPHRRFERPHQSAATENPGRRGDTVATILKLAIGRFRVSTASFRWNRMQACRSRRRAGTSMRRSSLTPPVRATAAISPSSRWSSPLPAVAQTAVAIHASFALEANRIDVASASLATGKSRVSLAGKSRTWPIRTAGSTFERAWITAMPSASSRPSCSNGARRRLKGSAVWRGGGDVSVAGHLTGTRSGISRFEHRLHNFTASGPLTSDLRTVTVRPMRLSGQAALSGQSFPVEANIAAAVLRGVDLELRQVSIDALDGNYTGAIGLRAFNRYTVNGAVAGLDVRRVASLAIPAPLPWDGTAGGSLQMEGSFHNPRALHLITALEIGPAAVGAPVEGEITADWDSPSEILDLGHSRLSLPHSRIAISGAAGRELSVHLETRDLSELLPALGERAAALPVKLIGSAAVFDGKVIGSLDHPQIQGHVLAGAFTYGDRTFDSFDTAVVASPDNVRLGSSDAQPRRPARTVFARRGAARLGRGGSSRYFRQRHYP